MREPKRKRLSPRQKKRLSLKKDRRNAYGESDKGSKRIVPLKKKLANRKVRRADHVNVIRDAESADAKLAGQLKSRWRKSPDAPLGKVVAGQLQERDFLRKTMGQSPRGRARYAGRRRFGSTADMEEG